MDESMRTPLLGNEESGQHQEMGNVAHATESKVYVPGIGELRNDNGFQIMQRTGSIGGEFGSRPGRRGSAGLQGGDCCSTLINCFGCCGSNGQEKERKMPMRIEPKVVSLKRGAGKAPPIARSANS